jgi:uncharacterized membrane protein
MRTFRVMLNLVTPSLIRTRHLSTTNYLEEMIKAQHLKGQLGQGKLGRWLFNLREVQFQSHRNSQMML